MDSAEARARIALQEDLHAFISLTSEEGGGPCIAVKDNIAVRDSMTTAGSIVLPAVPDMEDAPVIACIRSLGASVVGKANLHEWACGVTGANPHYGTVRNPVDPSRIAGGSSSGSAAAVAAGMCDWSVGTDTAGSIRVPSALCGIVGMRPSLGLVSTEGVIPLSTTLDTVGPMATSVAAVAQALAAMTGSNEMKSSRVRPLSAWRIGVPEGWVTALDGTTRDSWTQVARLFRMVRFPAREPMAAACSPIILWESADYHSRYLPDNASKYGSDVLAYLRRGAEVTAEDYRGALAEQRFLARAVEAAMAGLDAVVIPTTAAVAPPVSALDGLEQLLEFTRPLSITGQPIISIPIPSNGLPVGIQIVGHRGHDGELLEVALSLEGHLASRGEAA